MDTLQVTINEIMDNLKDDIHKDKEDKGVTQRVRFGLIDNAKNCTKRQSKSCEIDFPDPHADPFIPKDYCSLPVELGCTGSFKLLGLYKMIIFICIQATIFQPNVIMLRK